MSLLTLTINGTPIPNINSDFREEKTRMKDLDDLSITIINDTNDEAFDPDSEVIVTIDSITKKYLLDLDDFKRVAKDGSGFLYEHKLDLVEVTKYLEGITYPNRKFTQPLDATLLTGWTLWDVLENLRITAELKLGNDTNYLWTWDTSVIDGIGVNLQTYTDGILAKEITLNKPNAREALDQVLLQVDMEVRMTDFGVVGVELINNKNNTIDISDVIVYQGKQVLEQYADRLDLFVENAITENNINKQAVVYPSQSWASVRGSDSFLTSDNFIMEVEEPIDRILKFEVYLFGDFGFIGGGTIQTIIQADVTELLQEKSAYESLDFILSSGVGGYSDTPCRNNSVYYERNGTQIKGWHEEIDKFNAGFPAFTYFYFLAYAYFKATGTRIASGGFNDGYENFMFRITYVPLQDERLRIEKQNPLNKRTLFLNQNERIPDIERLGIKVQQDIKRLGNKQLIIGKTVENYADTIKIGDYYNDYIVEKVVNNGDAGEIISVAYLSKGAQSISLDVGVNTENRDTLIDASKAIVRHELYNEYMEVGFASDTNDSIMTQVGLERYSYTFTNSSVSTNPVEMVWYKRRFTTTDNLVLQCKSVGAGNVIKFDFGFDSPNVAGKQSVFQGSSPGSWYNKFVEYADSDGKVDEAFIYFFGKLTTLTPLSYTELKALAKKLPELDLTVADTEQIYFDTLTDTFKFYKDTGEVLKFTYQMSHFSVEDDVIIKEKISTNNSIITNRLEEVFLITSATPIPDRQYLLATDYDTKESIVTTGVPLAGEVLCSISNTLNYATFTRPNDGSYYWAIVNEDNEVYMIVNNLTEQTIYFNPKKDRS